MRKTFQKVAAILTAALLVFLAMPVSTTAYADETKTGIITINTDQGEYSIYQIFSLVIDDNGAYIYTAEEEWVDFLEGCYVDSEGNFTTTSTDNTALFTLNEVGVLSVDSAIFTCEKDSDVLKDFAQAAIGYAQTNTIEEDYNLPNNDSYSVSVNYGWYVIDSSLGTLVMVDNVNDDNVKINEKNGTPTIEKYITQDNQSVDTSANNTTVDFVIYIKDIANASGLVLHDALPDEMKFVDTSIVVTLFSSSSNTSGTELTKDTDYTLNNTSTSCTGTFETLTDVSCTFEIDFTGHDDLFADLENSAYIQVKYSVTVNTGNDEYTDNTDELINYAQLTYGDNGKSTVVEAKDELFGIEIVKYAYTTGTDTEYENTLSGATFTLQNSENKYASFTESGGVYYFEEWNDAVQENSSYVVSGTNGIIKIEGLDEGTYTLTETVAPDGYKLLKSSITVTITYSEGTPSWTWSYNLGEDSSSSDISGSDSTIYIGNLKGGALAGTGGIGTTIFYIVGGVIIVAAIILFITRKRMERAEKNK